MSKNATTVSLLVFICFLISLLVYSNSRNLNSPKETLFVKQEKCASHRDEAAREMEANYKLATPYFYEIFYSPKTDTCVFTYGLVLSGVAPYEIGKFIIEDYFTKEELFSIGYDNSSGNEATYSYNIRPKFSDALDSYKK